MSDTNRVLNRIKATRDESIMMSALADEMQPKTHPISPAEAHRQTPVTPNVNTDLDSLIKIMKALSVNSLKVFFGNGSITLNNQSQASNSQSRRYEQNPGSSLFNEERKDLYSLSCLRSLIKFPRLSTQSLYLITYLTSLKDLGH